jgi:hypothetical protein
MEEYLAGHSIREVIASAGARSAGLLVPESATGAAEQEARMQGARIGNKSAPKRALHPESSGQALDFSSVRVHTGDSAQESARQLSASAYTVGNDIVFGRGQYQPNTLSGRQLIAHELSHVVQQRNSRPSAFPAIQRQEEGSSNSGLVGDVVDWVKEKFKSKKEETADTEIAAGLDRAAKVYKAAALVEHDVERAEAYRETAEKLEAGSQNADKIIDAKEYISLILEFRKALKEAEPVDLSKDGPEGAKKLFDLMAVSGKLGKKIFPPPFNSYFDFLANMKNLENVGRAYGRPQGSQEMWDQVGND